MFDGVGASYEYGSLLNSLFGVMTPEELTSTFALTIFLQYIIL